MCQQSKRLAWIYFAPTRKIPACSNSIAPNLISAWNFDGIFGLLNFEALSVQTNYQLFPDQLDTISGL